MIAVAFMIAGAAMIAVPLIAAMFASSHDYLQPRWIERHAHRIRMLLLIGPIFIWAGAFKYFL